MKVFTGGKEYPVTDEGKQWTTKDDNGKEQVVVKGSEQEERLLGTFFKR